ncbi:UNVERIFIED_CONTAM: hypothetical protein GTU68_056037 [Idotea baltica]|nr:hypothetical protein [Idotea baltica]
MLLVASETGHVYTFATRKLQPMITSEAGKALIQTCLNSPDPPSANSSHHQSDQRMSATGYEETELTYAVTEEEHKVRQMMYPTSSTPYTPPPPPPPPSLSSPPVPTSSHHAAAAAAAVSLALQSHHHHHHPQYSHHSHPPPSPHLSSPHISPPLSSAHHLPHHSLSSQSPGSHSEHSVGLVGLHHHSSHIQPSHTPLPPQSPLPPVLSPMGTPSPTSPYALHHHPHHHISAHSR